MAKKTVGKVKKLPPKTGGAGSTGKKPAFQNQGLGKLKGSTDGKVRKKRLDDEIKRQGG